MQTGQYRNKTGKRKKGDLSKTSEYTSQESTCRRFWENDTRYPKREFWNNAIRTILSHDWFKKIKEVSTKTGKEGNGSNLKVNTRKQVKMQNTVLGIVSVHQTGITRIKMKTATTAAKPQKNYNF